MKLEEIGINGSDAENVCYLRDLADATKLVNMMRTCTGGNAIVVGGGYIGMECAAALVMNKINVTMVFPGSYCSKHFNQTISYNNFVHCFIVYGLDHRCQLKSSYQIICSVNSYNLYFCSGSFIQPENRKLLRRFLQLERGQFHQRHKLVIFRFQLRREGKS